MAFFLPKRRGSAMIKISPNEEKAINSASLINTFFTETSAAFGFDSDALNHFFFAIVFYRAEQDWKFRDVNQQRFKNNGGE